MINTPLILKTTISNNIHFYYLEGDHFVGEPLNQWGYYEPFVTQVMHNMAKKGDTVVDIGANIGYYSIMLAKFVGKSGKVYAFEPEPKNVELLSKNVKVNNLHNIKVSNIAISSKKQDLDLFIATDNYGDHRVFADNLETIHRKKLSIKADSIDNLFLGNLKKPKSRFQKSAFPLSS